MPTNTRGSANVGSMLGYRLRRWPTIETTLANHFVLAGLHLRARHSAIHAVKATNCFVFNFTALYLIYGE